MGHYLFGWRGRISRAPFCFFAAGAVFLLLVFFSALYFYQVMAGGYETGEPAPWPSTPQGIAGVAFWILSLFSITVSALAVTVKRLHDRNKSAWWLIVFGVAPNALSSFGEFLRDRYPVEFGAIAPVPDILAIALLLWAFVELACLAGSTGPNRFGEDPLNRQVLIR